ncbi:uncharacterized protein LOC133038412 [Cannabis sativa]|uniref:uncharacterized protein LOC133038412 n=1 Tax=Cannabis sativa TaxID=3483 RepID=UPI0029CA574E|nr:uncharacterized protein LOC133038412 [Cannabis sativa]
MALKLDLSKAYDRVDWHFLRAMMSRMGFSDKWIRLIYGCLSSVTYHIVSSGHTVGPIIPSRGLRQGDPISPYLFLICAEGLSALIQRYEERKLIHGYKVANGAPIVSHMLFADDSFLYYRATEREVANIQHMLEVFANASGQGVNFENPLFFHSIGRNKTAAFSYVVDKVQKRIQTWDTKFLSRAGKEILIKAVKSAMCGFWWKSNNSKGIHWLSWDKLAAHKFDGAKQGWMLLVCGDNLASKIFKARYFPNGTFLTATLGSNPSYIWRSVLESQTLVRAGARRLVGDGSRIGILHEPWLMDDSNPFIETSNPSLHGRMVNSLMKVDKLEWDSEVISNVLNDRDKELVWRIPLSAARLRDDWYWLKDSKGMFTVKSAYRI